MLSPLGDKWRKESFQKSLNKFSVYCQKTQKQQQETENIFLNENESHVCLTDVSFCFIHSRELHSAESGGEAGGERHGLLRLQRPRRQRQHGRVETQLQGGPSQPVPRSQPAGKLPFGSRVSSMRRRPVKQHSWRWCCPFPKTRWARSRCVPRGLGCTTCCSALRAGPSLTARSTWRVSSQYAQNITHCLGMMHIRRHERWR